MTKFAFKTVNKFLDEELAERRGGAAPEEGGLESVSVKKLSLKDQLFAHTSQAIRYLQANDLVPALPSQVDVVFTSVSLAEELVNRVKGVLGRAPAPQYSHLACCDPATNTIYVSSAYLTSSKSYADFTEALGVLGREFGGDTMKILERDLFHEIGHLALREKFKNQHSEDESRGLLAVMKANIEEGFADAFSLHLMALKHPEQPQFPHLRSYMATLSAKLQSDQISDVDVFRIYDMLPFMENAAVVTDIGKVVDLSWRASLENSKAMLLSKMNENPYFKQDVMKAIDARTDDPAAIVKQFHQQVANEGFDKKRILAVRSLYQSKDSAEKLKLK